MNTPLRSKQGCWTCRLRKKKCDETRPRCSTCESLSIPCYGYGPKPEWMNNADKEKEALRDLKQVVKHTSRRKAITNFSSKRRPTVMLAPKAGGPISSRASSTLHDIARPSNINSLQDAAYPSPEGSVDTPSDEHGNHQMTTPILSISAEETTLLMHFLDKVFPLQYPIYKPDILEGGRGWLLTLLLRTKQLYHAALALSSYHRRMMICTALCPPCRVVAIVQQEKHLQICLAEVQQAMKLVNQFVQSDRSDNRIGTVTSIVQLVFFELFTGEGSAWRIHLRAVIDLYDRSCVEKMANLGLTEKSRIIICNDQPLVDDGAEVTQEVVTLRFMGGTIIWLDIIASITAGTVPKLLPYHPGAIACSSQTKLEMIMGCKNRVMFLVGQIAALQGDKSEAVKLGQFNCREFYQSVEDIRKDIDCLLTYEALNDIKLTGEGFTEPQKPVLDETRLITRVFAYMALIYLHLVAYGYQNLDMINTAVNDVMRIFQTQVPNHLITALVLPLYIIACVTREGDEQRFLQTIFTSRPFLDPFFQHRTKITRVIEEIQSKRLTLAGFSWEDTLQLSQELLLI